MVEGALFSGTTIPEGRFVMFGAVLISETNNMSVILYPML